MSKTIMIVDDEKLIVTSTQMVLELAGYEVIPCFSGEDALQNLPQISCDLVLLDIMMPGMDGWEVLKRLKADEQTFKIPVIIFTAREHSRGRRMSLDLGAVDYFRKPFDPDELVALVEKYLTEQDAVK